MNKLSAPKVSVVIVTYNKLNLLKECLTAIEEQTYPVQNIIVINNNSTDGTKEFLSSQLNIIVEHTEKNIGGAGGFEKGIKLFFEKTTDDFCWIMDDDTIPDKDALKNLIIASKKLAFKFGFLSSFVYWTDGKPAEMNKPVIDENWDDRIDEGLLKIKSASFVSLLTTREKIEKVGLPIGEFFIWGDDVEYSERLSTKDRSYLVPSSKVLHKMARNQGVNILTDNYRRLPRYVFEFRNRFFVAKKRGIKKVLYELARNGYLSCKIILLNKDHKFLRVKQIIKGQFQGFVFNPSIKKIK